MQKNETKATYKRAGMRKEFKLFEANDIAKFGVLSAAGKLLSPIAYKALMFLIWKNNMISPGDYTTIELSITEFGNALGYDPTDTNYNFARDVKRACEIVKSIMSEPLSIMDSKKKHSMTFVWLYEADFFYEEDRMQVKFASTLSEYFGSELKADFTVIKLKYLNRLTTTAAITLYPFFCRYANMNQLTYSTEEMSSLLTGKPDYPYKDLKSKFLVPAIEQINKMTDLNVTFTENRANRKIVSVNLQISHAPAADEVELFMEENDLSFDEYHEEEYNTKWMSRYTYNMAKQRYEKNK